ncbi:MAG: PQQ-dependent sugar dehydrogenase [Proteobacteria bacterium]|nr:PQQ-dependent sugar dehydrogenase [Pseudomonadota bacterium]
MSLIKHTFYLGLVFLINYSNSTSAHENKTPLEIKTIAKDLGVPWGMILLPDNTMLITQREGFLSQLDLNNGQIVSINGLPKIKVKGQGGLFDIALSPNYGATGWIYFSYSKDISGQGATALSRAKLDNKRLIDWQDLLITESTTNTNVHYGGRISFDNNSHVFLTVGDRGVRSNAQNLSNHAGSILRLNLNGTIPTDNPYINYPNALAEIWTYGHRNPQGMFFNKHTQQLWAIEHGPRGGDEINLIKSGHNYGWPIVSYGMEYSKDIPVGLGTSHEGMEQPVKTYIPSIAPSGLIQYSGKAFPKWKNNLLTGSLKLRHLNKISLDDRNNAIGEARLLREINGRIRNIIQDNNGWLYVSTDDGRILRVKPE